MARGRVARAAANAALLAGSALLMLLVLEAGVRILRPQPMAAVARSPRLGWTHKVNADIVYERQEFRTPVHFSSAGLRDREYPLGKPAGTTRIAILGDSFVEALQVPLDSCMAKRLEARLNAGSTGGHRYEVLNFGVSGYGTCQQLLLLEETARRFHPDLVIAQYCTNDLDDDRRYSVCSLAPDGTLRVAPAVDLSFAERVKAAGKSFLLQHSHLWMFVSTRKPRVVQLGSPAETAAAPGAPVLAVSNETGGPAVPSCPGHHRTLEWRLTLRDELADAATAVEQHAAIWARMQDECRADGAQFLGVIGVSRTQVEPELYAASIARAECQAAAHDVDLPPERLAAAAAAHGVEVVDLLAAFRAAAAQAPLHFRIDGHWNAAGHRVAAAALYQALEARGILKKDAP